MTTFQSTTIADFTGLLADLAAKITVKRRVPGWNARGEQSSTIAIISTSTTCTIQPPGRRDIAFAERGVAIPGEYKLFCKFTDDIEEDDSIYVDSTTLAIASTTVFYVSADVERHQNHLVVWIKKRPEEGR